MDYSVEEDRLPSLSSLSRKLPDIRFLFLCTGLWKAIHPTLERGSFPRAFSKQKHKITKFFDPARGETRHSPLSSQACQENLSGCALGTCSDDPHSHLAEPTSELQVELT